MSAKFDAVMNLADQYAIVADYAFKLRAANKQLARLQEERRNLELSLGGLESHMRTLESEVGAAPADVSDLVKKFFPSQGD